MADGELFKYLEDNCGIYWLCDYQHWLCDSQADLHTDGRLAANPERTAARALLRDAGRALAAAEQALAGLICDAELTAAAKEQGHPRRREEDHPGPGR